MGSPVKSRDNLLLPDFSGKRHAKTRHVMGCHGISRHSHGQVRTKGGLHWYEQYCILKKKKFIIRRLDLKIL